MMRSASSASSICGVQRCSVGVMFAAQIAALNEGRLALRGQGGGIAINGRGCWVQGVDQQRVQPVCD